MKNKKQHFAPATSHFVGCVLCVALMCGLLSHGCVPTQKGRTAQRIKLTDQSQQPKSYYAGYSKKYIPYREKLATGDAAAVQKLMDEEVDKIKKKAKTEAEIVNKLRLIGLMERASLFLQTGEPDKALWYCRLGQDLIEERESESYLNEGVSAVGSFFADALGAGEFGRYDPPGYEKVMFLNLASMAYLLKGDDRAFNVARLGIQWQDEEKEKFEKELAEVKEKEKEKSETDSTKTKQKSRGLISALNAEFSKYNDTALKVSNAFVNPFGDYVTGMVNEFKSVKLKSLLSNAHIAYKQALKLNPTSKILQQAVKDTKRKKSASRLIHVVAMDGFVPEKKVLSIPIDRDIDVELPTYNPITSRVAKIKVMTTKDKTLATLSPVANVEALALRHQKDSLPYIQTMVLAATIRDMAMITAGNAFFSGLGGLVKNVMDSSQEPDTTSWMALPSTIMAARIYPPKGLKALKISSYNSKGKKIADKTVKLGKGRRHFVLVRSINEKMYAYPSKKIWSPKS